jgi:hypothetical protein
LSCEEKIECHSTVTKLYTRFCYVTETTNLYSRCDDFGETFFLLCLQNYMEKKYRLIHFVVISHEMVTTDTCTVRKHKVTTKLVVLWDRPISSLLYNPLYLSFTSLNTYSQFYKCLCQWLTHYPALTSYDVLYVRSNWRLVHYFSRLL